MGGTCIFGWMEPGGSHFDKEAARLLLKIAKHDCGLIIPGIAPVKDMLGGKWLYQNPAKFKKLASHLNAVTFRYLIAHACGLTVNGNLALFDELVGIAA